MHIFSDASIPEIIPSDVSILNHISKKDKKA
jgi:hypothetical protein